MGDWNKWQEEVDSYKEEIYLLRKALEDKNEWIEKLTEEIKILTNVVMEKIEVIRKLK